MGAVTPEALLTAWKLEQTTLDMAMGQVLQNLVQQQTALDTLNRALLNLRADIDRLLAHTSLPQPSKGKAKPGGPV